MKRIISQPQNNNAEMRSVSRNQLRLVARVIDQFSAHFALGAKLLYANDAQVIRRRNSQETMFALGVRIDDWNAMPDVVLLDEARNRFFLVDSVFGHGPIGSGRRAALEKLFSTTKLGCVYITAFPNRSLIARYLSEIAWETEVWVADAPSHMIHFNGDRFLGPHAD